MDERDSTTPNKDCWHSTYGNFLQVWPGPLPNFWAGPGDKASYLQAFSIFCGVLFLFHELLLTQTKEQGRACARLPLPQLPLRYLHANVEAWKRG